MAKDLVHYVVQVFSDGVFQNLLCSPMKSLAAVI